MKLIKITGLLLAIAAAFSCSALAEAAEVKKIKQVSQDGVKIEITAEENAGYVIEVFAPGVDSGEEWVPGSDASENTKELVFFGTGQSKCKREY